MNVPVIDVTLRELHWTDIPQVAELERRCFPEDTWSPDVFWTELAKAPTDAYYLVAVALGDGESAVVGYAGLAFIADEANVQTVAVAPERRGTGIAGLLLTRLLDVAWKRDSQRCLLEVRPDNEAALRLYDSFGFQQLAVRPRYYPGGIDAIVLECGRPASDERVSDVEPSDLGDEK